MNLRTLASAAACAMLLVASSPTAAAPPQPRLAVLEFEVQKDVSIDRRTFSTRVQNAARKAAPGFLVMTTANIEMLVRAAGKTLEQCEGQCAVDTGRLVGADVVIAGRISRVGRTLALSMQAYDTQDGALIAGEDVEAQTDDELLKASTAAAARLLEPLARRGAPPAETQQQPGRDAAAVATPPAQRQVAAPPQAAPVAVAPAPPATQAHAGSDWPVGKVLQWRRWRLVRPDATEYGFLWFDGQEEGAVQLCFDRAWWRRVFGGVVHSIFVQGSHDPQAGAFSKSSWERFAGATAVPVAPGSVLRVRWTGGETITLTFTDDVLRITMIDGAEVTLRGDARSATYRSVRGETFEYE